MKKSRKSPKKKKSVMKRSLTGIELEFNLIDSNGRICQNGPDIVSKVREKKSGTNIDTEAALNLVEIRSNPYAAIKKSIQEVLEYISCTSSICEENGQLLLPLSTYPGKFSASITPKKRYTAQLRLFDEFFKRKRFLFTVSRIAAFHIHYTLPYGVFDSSYRKLKPLVKSKAKESLLNSYNMVIAADPAVTTLLQSSPLVDCKFLAKDSRLALYRGGKIYKGGLYTGKRLFGALPPYVFTLEDLHYKIKYADKFWRKKMKRLGMYDQEKKKEVLDLLWNPVKINKAGTLEARNSDICQPKYFVGASILIKFILRKLQQEFYEVKPSDLGKHEPFKVEGNTIHVPPITYVRHYLQLEGAKNGFENKDVYNYSKRFFNFASGQVPQEYKKLLRPLRGILDRKKTVSDIILARLKRKGYSRKDEIQQEVCEWLALKSAKQMKRELPKLQKRVESISL